MTTFSVPTHDKEGGFFDFRVATGSVMFAGSRHLEIPDQVCSDLIKAFSFHGFSFITGCATGVDHSFRRALALSESKESSLVACAFKERAERISDICSLFVVPEGLHPRAALAKRTLWLVNRCSLLVLFPSDPIGKGSALAFRSAIYACKPVFVVSKTRPKESHLYKVLYSNLFGVVEGWWCIPHIYQETGLTNEEV